MQPVLAEGSWAKGRVPAGYRYAGSQAIRVDLAEKIFRAAFETRARVVAAHPKERNRPFRVDLALAVSVGLEAENARRLLGSAGFRYDRARPLPEGAQGAPAPDRWYWRPRRPEVREARREARGGERPSQHRRKPTHPAEGKPRDEAKPRGDKRDDRRNGKPGGKPSGKQRDNRPPLPKPDTGPARAGGAFDKLADLLKG
jgi:ATP-dependent RNA helicase SUPV3L1/SUV3